MLLLTVARPRGVLTRFPILPAGERETRMLFAEKIGATLMPNYGAEGTTRRRGTQGCALLKLVRSTNFSRALSITGTRHLLLNQGHGTIRSLLISTYEWKHTPGAIRAKKQRH
jgi:hypothetical protein